jgi:hypothetical protein
MSAKPLSLQRRHQIRNFERGMCQYHAHRPIYHAQICQACYEKKGILKPRPSKDKWAAVDWSQRTSVIAKKLGITCSAVSFKRRLLRNGIPAKSRWDNVDWSLPNWQIAQNLAVTQQAVIYQRKKHLSKQPC